MVKNLLLAAALLTSCVTINKNSKRKKPPQITAETPIENALTTALEYGGDSLKSFEKILNKQQNWGKLRPLLYSRIWKNEDNWPPHKFLNAIRLYRKSQDPKSYKIFERLTHSERTLSQQLAWHIASTDSSKKMRDAVNARLEKALLDNTINNLFYPAMAQAIAFHRLKGTYTILRRGLFISNHIEFARAMITLDPQKASEDFMFYLALAHPEELRQINLQRIDMLTCIEILKHLNKNPASIGHDKLSHLFFYAVSYNTSLRDLSRKLLENYLSNDPNNTETLALTLRRMPDWVKQAFIEGSRHNLTPKVQAFLQTIKKKYSNASIKQTIDNVLPPS